MGSVNRLLIGSPAKILIDNIDIGWITGDTVFQTGTDLAVFESGSPLATRAVIPIRKWAKLKPGMAEVSADAVQRILNGQTPTLPGNSYKRFNLGSSFSILQAKIEVQYTHPVSGKGLNIILWKAYSESSLELSFKNSEPCALLPWFVAMFDTAHEAGPGGPLGYLEIQE